MSYIGVIPASLFGKNIFIKTKTKFWEICSQMISAVSSNSHILWINRLSFFPFSLEALIHALDNPWSCSQFAVRSYTGWGKTPSIWWTQRKLLKVELQIPLCFPYKAMHHLSSLTKLCKSGFTWLCRYVSKNRKLYLIIKCKCLWMSF